MPPIDLTTLKNPAPPNPLADLIAAYVAWCCHLYGWPVAKEKKQ